MKAKLTAKQLRQWDNFNRDMDWFNANYSLLTKTYDKKIVAISNCKVIDSDKDLIMLLARLHKNSYDTREMVIEPVDSNPPHMILMAIAP